MSIDEKNHVIVWEPVPAAWAPPRRNGPVPGLLPHFVSGSAHARRLAGKPVACDERALFLGVLHTFSEEGPVPFPGSRQTLEDYLKRLLYNLCLRSVFDSLETMVLTLVSEVRSRNGSLPALKMLMTAYRVLPRSTEIKADLIMDVWAVVEACPQVDRKGAFELVSRLYEGIEPGR